jgi:DNA-directed RNA polymerase specialized sigma24 family protein
MRAGDTTGGLSSLSTTVLLDKASTGNQQALEELHHRYLDRLKRWARIRVPGEARVLLDTDSLVDRKLERTLNTVTSSSSEARGDFLGDVRRSIDEGIASELTQRKNSLAEHASAQDEGYEEAFRRLGLIDQTAIAARLEEGMTYDEIAHELGAQDADDARLAVSHAIVRLAQAMIKVRKA